MTDKETSKMALELIEDVLNYCVDGGCKYQINIIKNDLEVFEIIINKKVNTTSIQNVSFETYNGCRCLPYKLTKDEFNKIKEYLEQ